MEHLLSLLEYSKISFKICTRQDEEQVDDEQKILFLTQESLNNLEILTDEVRFLEIHQNYFRALNYAGIAKVGNLKIEILPKFFEGGNIQAEKEKIMNNLLYMLKHSNLYNFKELETADLDSKNDFLEVFIFLFAKNLAQLLKNQQDRQYVRYEDDLRFVREKIITSQYTSNPARLHIIPCNFHERSTNTLLNQTLRYTAYLLSNQVKSQETYRYLKQIISILDATEFVQIHPSDVKKIKFNRINSAFIPYIRFCELFLRNSTLTLQASHVEFFSLMIPMEKLFEEFIAQMIFNNPEILPQKYHDHIFIQKSIGCLAYEDERGLFEMRPDIIFDGQPPIIFDTKYKMLDPEDIKNKISQPDLYQMYAYCKEFRSNTAILLYPQGINAQVMNRVFSLGIEKSITLFVKTIPLNFDLSDEWELVKFLDQLKIVFQDLEKIPRDVTINVSTNIGVV
jgi:5-methylcytosine-specific restriction enzyme subunit McrC